MYLQVLRQLRKKAIKIESLVRYCTIKVFELVRCKLLSCITEKDNLHTKVLCVIKLMQTQYLREQPASYL